MSTQEFQRGDGRRHVTDPTATRFNARSRYYQRGGPGARRPARDRNGTGGIDSSSIRVCVGTGMPGPRTFSHDNNGTRTNRNREGRLRTVFDRRPNSIGDGTQWWRISIPQAGSLGKDRVMSTIKANFTRHFQPYHYFIDSDTNTGVFFVNSQEEADMLRRSNRKIEFPNHGFLSIMVSSVSSPAPLIDQDLRKHFRDFIIQNCYNSQTFQLNLSNLLDREELSSLGIYPQVSKAAIAREIIRIINEDLKLTRQLDFGSNKISNLNEFRNLNLDSLYQLSLGSNDIRNVEDLENLKQLKNLQDLFIGGNPFSSENNRRFSSRDDLISSVREILPQLRRLDGKDLPVQIGFGVDKQTVDLPKSNPHSVPTELQDFLGKFIDEYYRLFDTNGRQDLQACYHDSCLLSICVSPTEGSIVPTRSYRFGALIYDSRNYKKLVDDNKLFSLLRSGKSNVLDFLRVKFPATKHEGSSFHVDVISTSNNRAIFIVHGLFREVGTVSSNPPVRSFQRAFTCIQTQSGVLIVADHLMIINATEAQYLNLTRSTNSSTTSSSQAMESQHGAMASNNQELAMIQRLSGQTGMNAHFSKQCLMENNWNYDKSLSVFLDLKSKNQIPADAFH